MCGAPATNRCSACQKVAYCSNNCQRAHWKSKHKSQCCLFKIVKNPEKPELGRYVVATRDIAPGEVIMEEPPIAAGIINSALCSRNFQNVKLKLDFVEV